MFRVGPIGQRLGTVRFASRPALTLRQRRAAANGDIAHEIVVRRTEPTRDETVARVLASPVACRKVVRELSRRLRIGELADSQWQPVVAEILALKDTATLSRTRSAIIPGAPRWER